MKLQDKPLINSLKTAIVPHTILHILKDNNHHLWLLTDFKIMTEKYKMMILSLLQLNDAFRLSYSSGLKLNFSAFSAALSSARLYSSFSASLICLNLSPSLFLPLFCTLGRNWKNSELSRCCSGRVWVCCFSCSHGSF